MKGEEQNCIITDYKQEFLKSNTLYKNIGCVHQRIRLTVSTFEYIKLQQSSVGIVSLLHHKISK